MLFSIIARTRSGKDHGLYRSQRLTAHNFILIRPAAGVEFEQSSANAHTTFCLSLLRSERLQCTKLDDGVYISEGNLNLANFPKLI